MRRNEGDRLERMGAKKAKFLLLFFWVGESNCFPYESCLKSDGLNRRFLCMGSFLGKGFDFGPTAKKRMVSSEPIFSLYERGRVGRYILLHRA